jgi:hypothetical protein
MSNKNVRVKVRIHGLVDEIRDKSDASNRPGWSGTQRKIIEQINTVEIPREEWDQRLEDAARVLEHGYVLSTNQPPSIIADEETNLTHNAVTLNGTGVAWAINSVVTFQYGLTPALGTDVAADESPIIGIVNETLHTDLAGLTASTKYYWRIRLVNAEKTIYSLIKSFTTDPTP